MKKIPSSILQQQKIPPQNHAKSKISSKINEWGAKHNKAFQAIPDMNPKSEEIEAIQVSQDGRSHGIVTNHRTIDSSGNSNEIISIHGPSESAEYTSSEEEVSEYEDTYSTKNSPKPQYNDGIDTLALYNALFHATQFENSTEEPENCLVTGFTKTDSSRLSGSNGDNNSNLTGNVETQTTVSRNREANNFNSIENSQVRAPRNENVGINSWPFSAAGSFNPDVTNINKSRTLDSQNSSIELTSNENKVSPAPTLSISERSDMAVYTTANSSLTYTSANGGNMSSNIKNSVVPKQEVFNRDTYNRIMHNVSDVRNYNSEAVNSGQQPTSLSVSPDAGDSAQNFSLSSGVISQNGNSWTISKLGNREKVYPDGRKEIWYPNGNLKKISADGSVTKVIYYNGDVKETLKDGTVKYFYAETKTWHTTYFDGSEVLEFPE